MPYSFIEIEKRKKWVIAAVFFSLVIFYFLVAEILWVVTKFFFLAQFQADILFRKGSVVSFQESVFVFLVAFSFALGHWLVATANMIEKILGLLGARELDERDTYHQILGNIVEEVGVATGGVKMRCCVVPISALNAFAITDLKGNAVIGVTEGLLGRLSRSQLESVIAHEAAHVVSEDSLIKTITCSLFGVYAALLEGVRNALACSGRSSRDRGEGGGPIAYLVVIYIILSITQFINLTLNMFLSRQQEYRADAIAVKLTRNPIAFAEALYLISRGWRGVGGISESLAPIFIMNPDYNRLEEAEGAISDLFSTHPPTSRRLSILLGMAHADITGLKTGLKPKIKLSAEEGVVSLQQHESIRGQWLLYRDDDWKGPYGLEELFACGVSPNSWISRVGENIIKHASEDETLYKSFKERLLGEGGAVKENEGCPQCKEPLVEMLYEGAPILKCHYCGGILAQNDIIMRIMAREDFAFGPEIVKAAEEFLQAYYKGVLKGNFRVAYSFDCPQCRKKMIRGFYSYGYPIQIDRCDSCGQVWFDKNELEILQYLSEKARHGKSVL